MILRLSTPGDGPPAPWPIAPKTSAADRRGGLAGLRAFPENAFQPREGCSNGC